MTPPSVARRLTAAVALVGWLGLAGGSEAGQLLSRALGLHGACRMACCRGPEANACARGAGSAGHGADHREATRPSSQLSIAARPGCEKACALLASEHRTVPSPVLAAVAATDLATATVPVPGAPSLPTRLLLRSISPRAPPA